MHDDKNPKIWKLRFWYRNLPYIIICYSLKMKKIIVDESNVIAIDTAVYCLQNFKYATSFLKIPLIVTTEYCFFNYFVMRSNL